jgi:hypothetical protein
VLKVIRCVKRSSLWTRRMALIVASMLVGALCLAAVAFADNVVNDVAVDTNTNTKILTITAGDTTGADVGYRIVATGGDGESGCNATAGSPVTVTPTGMPAGVTTSPLSRSFSSCGTAQSITFKASAGATPGDYPIAVSTSDSGAGTYNTTPGGFTLRVVAGTPADTTPPSIDYTLNPAEPDGNAGWYKSDVTLTWSVTENETPGSLVKTGCVDQNITADQQETTYSCSATSDGGSAGPVEVKIKRDASAPNLACGPGPSGWQANNVTLSCTAADVGPSGLANSGDEGFQLSTNVAAGSETSNAQTGSKTVIDSAGNSATIGPFSFMVDRKAPTVSCDSPAPSFLLHQSPADVTGTAADGGSGPASQNLSEPADTFSVGGGKTVTLTASDAVDNQGSATCSYSVGYKFEGFYTPVDNPNVLNNAKAGQAIPLKWRLLDANNNPVTSLSSVKVTVTSLNCTLATTPDALEEYAAGSSGLQNLGNGYYQFNWKSPTTYANSCKTLNLDLGEGSPRTALFKFTK